MKRPGNTLLLGLTLVVLVGLVRLVGYTSVVQRRLENCANDLNFTQEIHLLRATVQKTFEVITAQQETQDNLPTIYVVTPTYQRLEQIPELTRLGQTLMNVPKVHWIVAEDTNQTNQRVVQYLKFTGLPYTYLLTPKPQEYWNREHGINVTKGVANRNGAMDWIRNHATEGVMYLADDDNSYDIRLFEEMRYTKRVSMFPVGLVTELGISTPVVKDGKFAGWFDGYIVDRKFPVDMAGFAVSVQYLLSVPDAKMPFLPRHEETGFLSSLPIKPEEIEFKADNCTKVYVWHTQTLENQPASRAILDSKYDGTNLRLLQTLMTISKE